MLSIQINHYRYLSKYTATASAALLAFLLVSVPGYAADKNTKIASTLHLPYGVDITHACAKIVANASVRYAQSKGWNISVAVVDSSGRVITLQRMDNAHKASVDFALSKASSAALTKRSTKIFSDALEKGRQAILGFTDLHVLAVEGGEVVIQKQHISGAIGVAGVSQAQDREIALAGLMGLSSC